MFVRIDNIPRDYAWGSTTAIATLRGRTPSGGPEAELWLGAHPASPARIADPGLTGGAEALDAWIAADPERAVGAASGGRLPFLLKVLAAAGPLSLQAHPSPAQAREGFDRENAAGVPIDAPNRNYKDPFHKPEMLFVLSETFDALCGFRSRSATAADLARLADAGRGAALAVESLDAFLARLAAAPDDASALRDAVAWLLAGGAEVAELVTELIAASRLVLAETGADDFEAADALDPVLRPFATVVDLADAYPGDPGIALSLLLNRVRLPRGEALYLPAGNIHAYLRGTGVELMAASDNVLRGGLTPKHVDVPELLSVLDFTPLPAPLLEPETPAPGVLAFRPEVPDFALVHVDPAVAAGARVPLAGPAIAIATTGGVRLRDDAGAELVLEAGDAVFVTPDADGLTVSGAGELFIATVGE